MTGSIRTLIIVLTSSLFIATQSFASNLDSSDMDFAFGNSEQSTINPLGGEFALLSPEEMLATEGDFIWAAMFWGAIGNWAWEATKGKFIEDYEKKPLKQTLTVGAISGLMGGTLSRYLFGLGENQGAPIILGIPFKKDMNDRWNGPGSYNNSNRGYFGAAK